MFTGCILWLTFAILGVNVFFTKFSLSHGQITEETETLEQRVIAAATPSELLRFSVVENTESDAGDKERSTRSMTVGEKVGRRVVDLS